MQNASSSDYPDLIYHCINIACACSFTLRRDCCPQGLTNHSVRESSDPRNFHPLPRAEENAASQRKFGAGRSALLWMDQRADACCPSVADCLLSPHRYSMFGYRYLFFRKIHQHGRQWIRRNIQRKRKLLFQLKIFCRTDCQCSK